MKYLLLALTLALFLTPPPIRADDPAVPDAGFNASRYESLWTKSPFAVATAEAEGESSPDYFLVGIANIDGISYASVIERQNQEHFLISTDKANRGMTLTSINRNHDGTSTYAVVQKDGQLLTLKLELPPAGPPPGATPMVGNMNPLVAPGPMVPQIQMPGSGSMPGAPPVRPFARFHRTIIHPPPNPQQGAPAAQAAPTPPPQ